MGVSCSAPKEPARVGFVLQARSPMAPKSVPTHTQSACWPRAGVWEVRWVLTTSSQGMPDMQGPLVARLASLLLWLSSLLRSTSPEGCVSIFMQTGTCWSGEGNGVHEYPGQQAGLGTFPGKPQHWSPSSETRGLTQYLAQPLPFLDDGTEALEGRPLFQGVESR